MRRECAASMNQNASKRGAGAAEKVTQVEALTDLEEAMSCLVIQ